ncbi:bifunctional aspartate transaminase/aspartate 4-decarboxylase [Barnesiella propionica]|uniref:bifunctional aspartate transaminase/aspartate 4-decarboxylase n=1 Tax=Barnesiella propionica TaxID=2981781 RepID=UPI0011CCDD4D
MNSKEKKPFMMKDYGKKMEKGLEQMSPFEIKNELIKYAKECDQRAVCQFLNAGRGNPNWINTVAREAFLLVSAFGIEECKRTFFMKEEDIAGIPDKEGISKRFEEFLERNIVNNKAAALLKESYHYLVHEKGADADALVHEWAEGTAGDQYPDPDRILKYTEQIIEEYLIQEMCDRQTPPDYYELFATEGGTAAMCYLFNSLKANKIVNRGDRIALMVPIFTPYIEIPALDEFHFDVVNINASKRTEEGYHTWQYPKEELDKLRDPSIKVLCLVNPSNPPSYALDKEAYQQLIDIVKKDNPKLMIITDDVYGTFVPHFRSLMYELPYNTACVYSFSKYFGATGWRLAVIAIARNNIFDTLISELPESKKHELHRRYESISMTPDKLKFIDRLVADSRLVALNHTAGLSTPQQIQMSLFALYALMDKKDRYKNKLQKVIKGRLEAMWENSGFKLLPDPLRAGYYSEIDIMVWAKKIYGEEFAKFLEKNYEPLDFVLRLAKETGVVLLNGDGFDGPNWSVRASLANLDEKAYKQIGTILGKMLEEYAAAWKVKEKAEVH